MQLVQFFIFSFFISFIISFSYLSFGLPSGRLNVGFHLHTLFTILSSGIWCKWPKQLNLCAFRWFIVLLIYLLIIIKLATCFDPMRSSSDLHYEPINVGKLRTSLGSQ